MQFTETETEKPIVQINIDQKIISKNDMRNHLLSDITFINKCEHEGGTYLTIWPKPEAVLPPHNCCKKIYLYLCIKLVSGQVFSLSTVFSAEWYGFTCNCVFFQLCYLIFLSLSFLICGKEPIVYACHAVIERMIWDDVITHS